MRSNYLRFLIALFLLAGFTGVNAQQRPVKKRPAGSAYGNNNQQPNQQQPSNSGYGNVDTTVKPAPAGNSSYGNTNNAATGIDTTLPITVIKSSGGNGLLDSTKMSLRNDGAVEKNAVTEQTPLAYENIREDDAVFVVRVWREIDAREKMNLGFRYAAVEDNGSQRFISILLRAIQNGDVTAFSGDDDRFTTPITADDAVKALSRGASNLDTSKKYDADGNLIGYEVRSHPLEADSIYKFQLKEEWIFDKESSRMYVRIIGIAPVVPFKLSTGEIVPNSDAPAFWVYYPDMRPILAKYEVYNPKNIGAEMTWEELFESRMFSSYIVKSTVDNPYDVPLSTMYPNNTLFRLLDGEKIKDKIFNYEQSLWSY
ncbi:MAG TPA: gliding motility protein GldN [Chitinophagaceae bacterium]